MVERLPAQMRLIRDDRVFPGYASDPTCERV
jgi:hypothetical protein